MWQQKTDQLVYYGMRKIFTILFSLVLLGGISSQAIAQDVEDRLELGFRLNLTDAFFDAAVDATYNISSGNRIHGNLFIGNGGLGVDLIHDWTFSFDGNRRLIFYPGLGGSLYFLNDDVVLGVTGEAGLEYRFDIPLSLGIDYRLIFTLTPETNLANNGLGLNLRYRF